jgi:hypothetical protein
MCRISCERENVVKIYERAENSSPILSHVTNFQAHTHTHTRARICRMCRLKIVTEKNF